MKDISKRIQDYNATRLPDLMDFKYQCMVENLFRFYRATCHIFFEDLHQSDKIPSSPLTWISGDLHLENFGSFRGDNGLVYFDLNDFDEALLAPATWELARMLTSIFIAFESLNIDKEKALRMSKLFLTSYIKTLAKRKADYVESNTARGIICNFLDGVSKRKQKTILDKRTSGNKKMDLDHPGHLALEKSLQEDVKKHITGWLQKDDNSPYNYKVMDVVFRVAGTSSLALNRYAVLLKSVNNVGNKYLLLDMKQAINSSLQPFLQNKQPVWDNPAERILYTQQLMQNRSPALLSATFFKGNYYIIQEMQPVSDSINFKLVKKQYRDMCLVIDTMGMLTASAHLRSTGHKGAENADALVAFSENNKWQEPLLAYANEYADKMQKYYAQFTKDYKKGKLGKPTTTLPSKIKDMALLPLEKPA